MDELTNLKDEEVINLAKKGDKKAFVEIYQRYREYVAKFASGKLRTNQDVEDVVEDTFIRARKSFPKLRNAVAFKSWLLRIAHAVIADWWRKRFFEVPLNQDLAENKTEYEQKSEKLEDILAHLPQNYQQILRLRFLDNLSIKETAKLLGKSVGAVKVMQYRALKRLGEDYG